ncbi:MAG: hypothetical protein HY754_13985 [Nitrospirae bacterium]|nr:hypothetical protein [Nitrospirota bacterium]
MDVTKYLLTVGVIGGALTERFSLTTGFSLFVIAFVVFMVGFYAIPEKKKEGE